MRQQVTNNRNDQWMEMNDNEMITAETNDNFTEVDNCEVADKTNGSYGSCDEDSCSDTDDSSSPPSPVVIVRRPMTKQHEKRKRKPTRMFLPLTDKQRNWIAVRMNIAKREPNGWTKHTLKSAPSGAKFDPRTKQWTKNGYKGRYQNHLCRHCQKKRTKTYCVCSVGDWMCKECHSTHILLKFTGRKQICEQLTRHTSKHRIETAPKHAYMYSEAKEQWILTSKNKYQKFRCSICQLENMRNHCRTHCICNRNNWMCCDCHRNKHLLAKCPRMREEKECVGSTTMN